MIRLLLAAAWFQAAPPAPPAPQDATPPRRAHHALVYDESRGAVLLTAGSTPVQGGRAFTFFNDLWSWDGARWQRLGASGEPLSGNRLAWDAARQRVVSFGGYNGSSLGVLRVLEGDTWRTIGERAGQPAAEGGFVYDAARRRFVAFGGSGAPGQANAETWELDGTAWARIEGEQPPVRQAHVMVYDERRGRTVLFGGMGAAPMGTRPPALGDTWEFDGRRWSRVTPSGPAPSARNSAGAAYDARRGIVILFGGVDSSGFLGDTWSWDGSRWRLLATAGPAPRGMGYLAYDKRRDRVVLFGGRNGWPDGDLDDTWEWDGAAWRRVR